jgi:YHS domain-containing protein
MIILVRLFLFLLLALMAVRSLMRFLAGIAAGAAPDRTQRPPQQVMGHMVKDPVCETYIPRRKAISRGNGPDTRYFCSAACADKYLARS